MTRQRKTVHLYTDGGSRGNPGPSAIGIVICNRTDMVLKQFAGPISDGTNNEAEYKAIIKGLQLCAEFTSDEVVCISDSKLLVSQMNGKWRVKNRHLWGLKKQAVEAVQKFKTVSYVWKPRCTPRIALADMILNDVLNEKMYGAPSKI